MESDSWTRFSTASRRHQSALQSRYDLYLGIEDVDGGDEEPRAEFPCPFCSEDFDIVGLCCHIDDEHQVEAKNGMSSVVGENVVPAPSNNFMAAGIAKLSGKKMAECWDHFDLIIEQDGKKRVCPVCAARVGMNLVGHITTQHGNFFKMQRRRRFRRGFSGSHSTLSLLRKELREGNLQALLGGSSYMVPPSNAAPDPLLSSLIYTLPVADSSSGMQPESVDEEILTNKSSDVKVIKSVEPSPSENDQKERACRSEFVQGLLLSTIFDNEETL